MTNAEELREIATWAGRLSEYRANRIKSIARELEAERVVAAGWWCDCHGFNSGAPCGAGSSEPVRVQAVIP